MAWPRLAAAGVSAFAFAAALVAALLAAPLADAPAAARQQGANGAGDASPRGLIAQGDGERLKGRYAEALTLYESAHGAAEAGRDTAAAAAALTGMARV